MSPLIGSNFRQRLVVLVLGTLLAGCAAPRMAPGAAHVRAQPSVAATSIAHPAPLKPVVLADLPIWRASEANVNLRLLLQRWADRESWLMVWDVDSDIPITASATFRGSFKQAVREVVASTELTDYPLKPCFYSNNVLRVVPMATKCDPNE